MLGRTKLKHPSSFVHSSSIRTLFRICSFAACILCSIFLARNTAYLKEIGQERQEILNYTAASFDGHDDDKKHQPVIGKLKDTPEKSKMVKSKQSTKKKNTYHAKIVVKQHMETKASPNDKHNKDEESLPLRLCRIKIDPGQKNLTVTPIMVQYQCAGSAYDNFSHKLLELASNPKKYGKDAENWGKRNRPAPANSTIVFLGNSHTRQVFQTFMCQFQNDIINTTVVNDLDGKGSGILRVQLKENITVYAVTNLPHVYSPRWPDLLKASMNLHTFNSVDALVLGKFNTFKESANSTFLLLMKKLTAGTDADFERRSPPGIEDVAKVYAGPIITVSMFAQYGVGQYQNSLKTIKALQKKGRTNIYPIDGRQYVPYIGECASDSGMYIGTCLTTDKSPGKRHVNGHRCVGRNGGHPDLVSWDIIELLHRVIKK